MVHRCYIGFMSMRKMSPIEVECGFCGHTEEFEVEVRYDEYFGEYTEFDCSESFGATCPKCGEEDALCPSDYVDGGSHYNDAREERRQMGLCNF